jgi:hypothetical protein
MYSLDCELGSTVFIPFCVNDTGGSAADGSSPVADVRLCGAAADAAPVYSPTVTGPLSHANYGDGLYEVPVACTEGNGFAAGNYYTVYAGATVDTETPQAALAIIRVVAAGDSLHSGAARVMDAVPDAAAGAAGGLAIVGSEMDLVDAPNSTALEAIDTILSGTHGSGAWGGAAGSGANTVTVTVQTSGGTVYSGVTVSINNQTETGTAYTVQTNSLGQAVFYLDTGNWRAIAAQSREQGGGATNFTVDGAESVTVTVTALSVPAAASADNYLLYGYERKVEADAAFGASGVTVQVVSVSPAGQTDATANACRRVMGTSYVTDSAGLWSFEIAKTLADSRLKLKFSWTDSGGAAREEQWQANIAASAANASDQIAWADLSPSKTR